ncbi:MAG: hypothetical protein ACYS8Z_23215 [Planctomycetota bacterium]|jgi:hypothetical protein
MMNVKVMKSCVLLFCGIVGLCGEGALAAEFYREYPARQDSQISNSKRWLRVNDPELSLHETFGRRSEARANGLMLVDVNEDLFQLVRAELRLELWGGHPGTANKTFALNGKAVYGIPEVGAETKNCVYSYPVADVNVAHLVRGVNAFQFACERGSSFWGHYIIDDASVRCVLKDDHPDLKEAGLDEFMAEIALGRDGTILSDTTNISIYFPQKFAESIVSVDYFARYLGFDDTGSGTENDWHGFTHKGQLRNHIGSASKPPFNVKWDTSMIPSQAKPMAVRAVVHLKDGFHYVTDTLGGLAFPKARKQVEMYRCTIMPVPFWSRASRLNEAQIELPDDILSFEKVHLMVKIWDGGEGNIKEPFKINGHPYSITSGKSVHDVVFTIAEVNPEHLKTGRNVITLLSDTEHHGIEILLPGPVLIARHE